MLQKYTAHLHTDWPDSELDIFSHGLGWEGEGLPDYTI